MFTLTFDVNIPNDIIAILSNIEGFKDIPTHNIATFTEIETAENADVSVIVKRVKDVLKTEQFPNIDPIDKSYNELVTAILSVGNIYSSFVEVVFANLYVNRQQEVIRYALHNGGDTIPYRKYNIKKLHTLLSPVLSLLFEPNLESIERFYKTKNRIGFNNGLSIFEKIWLNIV